MFLLLDVATFVPYPPLAILKPFRGLFGEGVVASGAGLLVATCLVFLSNNVWILAVAIATIVGVCLWRWRAQLIAVVDPPKSAAAPPPKIPLTPAQQAAVVAALKAGSLPAVPSNNNPAAAPPAPGATP